MTDKVLIVDDEQDFLDVLSDRLKTRDMNVSTASSAKDAIKKIDAESYDAVVLDLMMPEMDGLELAIKVRAMPNYANVPIMMITTEGGKQDVIEALTQGVNQYIVKPFNQDVLQAKMAELLKPKA